MATILGLVVAVAAVFPSLAFGGGSHALLADSIQANAQADSVKTNILDEVVVEGDNRYTSATKSTYIPSRQQRKAAQTGSDLLLMMAIPEIHVDTQTRAIKALGGGTSKVFINGIEASEDEIKGLNTDNVRKVEVLYNPTDARFLGVAKAINFIVLEYEIGGYTKFTTDNTWFSGISNGEDLFSRLAYKKMTYDLFADFGIADNRHNGEDSRSIYMLQNPDGTLYEAERTLTHDDGKKLYKGVPVTFQATYQGDKATVRNIVGFRHRQDHTTYGGTVSLPESDIADNSYSSITHRISNALTYRGSFFFSLPKDFSLYVGPQFKYSHVNDLNDYAVSEGIDITRHARENAYGWGIYTDLSKRFKKHSLNISLSYFGDRNSVRYTGTYRYNDLIDKTLINGSLGYGFQSGKWNINAKAGVSDSGWKFGDIHQNFFSPYANFHVDFSPNSHNRLSLFAQYTSWSNSQQDISSDILRKDEYMYYTGNPELKNYNFTNIDLTYIWMPCPIFSAMAVVQWETKIDMPIQYYEHYDDGKALLRGIANDGNNNTFRALARLSLSLFNRSLNLSVNPNYSWIKNTGKYGACVNTFYMDNTLTYMINKWYFTASLWTCSRHYDDQTQKLTRNPMFYYLGAGVSLGNWNLMLRLYNFGNYKWKSGTETISTPLYMNETVTYASNYRFGVRLNVTYVFDYGKKVQRGQEIGAQSGAESAILK